MTTDEIFSGQLLQFLQCFIWIYSFCQYLFCAALIIKSIKTKLDGVGPVDNRPSIDKLQNFVKKEEEKKLNVTCDMRHVTSDK